MDARDISIDDPGIVWDWRVCGICSGVSETAHDRSAYFEVPYWFVVSPLTLISAWLLLSKQSKPA